MVADKSSSELTHLSQDEKKDAARRSLKKEISDLMTQEAKWIKEYSPYDNLPPHEKPFNIEPFPNERQRLPFKMSEEDRMRRKIWVKSQELTEREPVRVPELETMIYNPIRRLYRVPTDKLFSMLAPVVGEHRVPLFRYTIPKLFLAYVGACVLWYNVKYNPATWEEKKGFTFIRTRGIYLPEEEKPKQKNKWDYNDRGFQARTAFKGPDYAY